MVAANETLGGISGEAGRALFRLGRVFARMPRRDLLAPAAGGVPDLSVILLVQAVEDAEAEGEEATVGVLAVRLGVDPSTASRLVAQAVRGQHLRRVALPEDGRAVALTLTDNGRDLAAGAARYQRAVFEEATRGWSHPERDAFARQFVRFAAGVAGMLAPGQPGAAPGPRGLRNGDADDGSRALATVAAWHAALNAGDADGVTALAHPDVAMAGPRGDAVGANLLRDWATHAGIRLEPRRWFRRGDRVVVEQHAAWRDPATGAFGEPTTVATVFRVAEGQIARIDRHPDLATALAAAGIDPDDELAGP